MGHYILGLRGQSVKVTCRPDDASDASNRWYALHIMTDNGTLSLTSMDKEELANLVGRINYAAAEHITSDQARGAIDAAARDERAAIAEEQQTAAVADASPDAQPDAIMDKWAVVSGSRRVVGGLTNEAAWTEAQQRCERGEYACIVQDNPQAVADGARHNREVYDEARNEYNGAMNVYNVARRNELDRRMWEHVSESELNALMGTWDKANPAPVKPSEWVE